jgi:hypothetical protein
MMLIIASIQNAAAQNATRNLTFQFTSKENSRVPVHSLYHYHFTTMDSSARPVIFSLKELPAWLTYNAADHSISGKSVKPGQYPIHLTATNGKDTAYQSFMVTVYNNKTANILCIGNSITNGTSIYNSYRRPLWKLLHDKNYNFDFIGSWSKHNMGEEVPDPDFDMDHEGHSGWTFNHIFRPPDWDSIRGNIHQWLQIYKPDLVLSELGTNDVFQCRTIEDMMIDLSGLLQELRKRNKHVKIFIAQIPPLGAEWAQKKLCGNNITYDQAIHNLNRAIDDFAKTNSTTQSPVVVVDQYSGIDPAVNMYDDIHPNTSGEKIMAERWYKAIRKYLRKID